MYRSEGRSLARVEFIEMLFFKSRHRDFGRAGPYHEQEHPPRPHSRFGVMHHRDLPTCRFKRTPPASPAFSHRKSTS